MYEQIWRYLQSVADDFFLWRGSSFAVWQALRIGQIALSLELSWNRAGVRSFVRELVSIQTSVLLGSSPLGFSLGVRAVCIRGPVPCWLDSQPRAICRTIAPPGLFSLLPPRCLGEEDQTVLDLLPGLLFLLRTWPYSTWLDWECNFRSPVPSNQCFWCVSSRIFSCFQWVGWSTTSNFLLSLRARKSCVLFGTKFSGKFTVHKFCFKQQRLSQKRVHKNRVDLKLGGVASVNGCTTYSQTKVEIISLNPGFLSYKTVTPALPIVHIFLRLRCLWRDFVNCKQQYKYRILCCCCLCLVACECVKLASSTPDVSVAWRADVQLPMWDTEGHLVLLTAARHWSVSLLSKSS